MPSNRGSGRNQRNNPYQLDELFIKFNHTPAGIAWRWRTELLTLTALAAVFWRLDTWTSAIWAGVILGGLAAVVAAVPHSRRFITRRFWCVLARHRLQRGGGPNGPAVSPVSKARGTGGGGTDAPRSAFASGRIVTLCSAFANRTR